MTVCTYEDDSSQTTQCSASSPPRRMALTSRSSVQPDRRHALRGRPGQQRRELPVLGHGIGARPLLALDRRTERMRTLTPKPTLFSPSCAGPRLHSHSFSATATTQLRCTAMTDRSGRCEAEDTPGRGHERAGKKETSGHGGNLRLAEHLRTDALRDAVDHLRPVVALNMTDETNEAEICRPPLSSVSNIAHDDRRTRSAR